MARGKPHINLVVIGHVDHGKSTTVGRILFNTGKLTEKEAIFTIIDTLSYSIDKEFNKARLFSNLSEHGYFDDKYSKIEIELYLNRVMPKGFKSACPFKVSIYRLENASEKSFQIVFSDLTTKHNIDSLLQAHYQTIISYTKESLRNKLSKEETAKFILAMHEYSKRIHVSE